VAEENNENSGDQSRFFYAKRNDGRCGGDWDVSCWDTKRNAGRCGVDWDVSCWDMKRNAGKCGADCDVS
jgi:uncharacterized low-complexity protein